MFVLRRLLPVEPYSRAWSIQAIGIQTPTFQTRPRDCAVAKTPQRHQSHVLRTMIIGVAYGVVTGSDYVRQCVLALLFTDDMLIDDATAVVSPIVLSRGIMKIEAGRSRRAARMPQVQHRR